MLASGTTLGVLVSIDKQVVLHLEDRCVSKLPDLPQSFELGADLPRDNAAILQQIKRALGQIPQRVACLGNLLFPEHQRDADDLPRKHEKAAAQDRTDAEQEGDNAAPCSELPIGSIVPFPDGNHMVMIGSGSINIPEKRLYNLSAFRREVAKYGHVFDFGGSRAEWENFVITKIAESRKESGTNPEGFASNEDADIVLQFEALLAKKVGPSKADSVDDMLFSAKELTGTFRKLALAQRTTHRNVISTLKASGCYYRNHRGRFWGTRNAAGNGAQIVAAMLKLGSTGGTLIK